MYTRASPGTLMSDGPLPTWLVQFWSHLQLIEAYLLARGVPVAVLSSNVMKRKDDMRAQLSKWVPSMVVVRPSPRASPLPMVNCASVEVKLRRGGLVSSDCLHRFGTPACLLIGQLLGISTLSSLPTRRFKYLPACGVLLMDHSGSVGLDLRWGEGWRHSLAGLCLAALCAVGTQLWLAPCRAYLCACCCRAGSSAEAGAPVGVSQPGPMRPRDAPSSASTQIPCMPAPCVLRLAGHVVHPKPCAPGFAPTPACHGCILSPTAPTPTFTMLQLCQPDGPHGAHPRQSAARPGKPLVLRLHPGNMAGQAHFMPAGRLLLLLCCAAASPSCWPGVPCSCPYFALCRCWAEPTEWAPGRRSTWRCWP